MKHKVFYSKNCHFAPSTLTVMSRMLEMQLSCSSTCFAGHVFSKLFNESQFSLGTALRFINAKINRPGVDFITCNVFSWQ